MKYFPVALLILLTACTVPPPIPPPQNITENISVVLCPPSCDDSNACTLDKCNTTTGLCVHDPQACCGDSICQENETKCSCPSDCGKCEGSFAGGLSYVCQIDKCVLNQTINETRLNASSCDDHDACTVDIFSDICIHHPITPCCGNGRCESGESCDSCALDCRCEATKDLSDFPHLFSSDPIVITGDHAPAVDQLSATVIANSVFAGSQAKLASEVGSLQGKDAIVVGSPCVNDVSRRLLGNPTPCDKDLSSEYATITLVPNGPDALALLVMSSDPSKTRIAATVLANYARYTLHGESVQVRGTLDAPVVS